MKTMYPADNIGKDGTVYPTVGKHIRKTVYFGGLDIIELTSSELDYIKAYSGIV